MDFQVPFVSFQKGVEISIFWGILHHCSPTRFITQLLLQGMLMLLESEVYPPSQLEGLFKEMEMDLLRGSGYLVSNWLYVGL